MKTLLVTLQSDKARRGDPERIAVMPEEEKDREFFYQAFYAFMRAMDRAENTSEKVSPRTCESIKKTMKEEIEKYMFEHALKEPSLHEDNLRFITALHAMVDAEGFELESLDDVRSLHFAFSAQLYMASGLVEHYVASGEFMDVLSLLAKSVPLKTLSSKEESVLISEFDVLRTHSRLRALHDFDMQRHKELEHQGEVRGDDENFVLQLPLEIRMNFAQTHEGNSGGMSP